MPDELQEWLPREGILNYEELLRVIEVGASLGVRKVRITGGEPLTRRDVVPFLRKVVAVDGIESVGLSSNGTLLANRVSSENDATMAQCLADMGIDSVNVSLDTLDRERYAHNAGRDYLPRVLEGIDEALQAGIPSVKLNAVLMRGQNETELTDLIDFAHEKGLLLRFIELMPVSTQEVLSEDNFLASGVAKKKIEERLGELEPRPDFKTNGPASYYRVPGRDQLIGFIGAMTNLHFCESCNKLRLTCDGKLRPCLGSYLEFDLLKVLRDGATDDGLRDFFRDVVERKPKEHDFRDNYQPNRRMIAIGG